jgi:hypothetical protein
MTSLKSLKSTDDLIYEMDNCEPLASEIYRLFVDFEESLRIGIATLKTAR